MQGDFSRLTFDPRKRFTRVLMQQGRVQLDADWNEQAAILLHYIEQLAADVIGPFGGPEAALGFAIVRDPASGSASRLKIEAGRYYVDGLLAENPAEAFHPASPNATLETAPFLVYLDVWERPVFAVEDASFREVALGGPDTAIRAQVVWQVRAATALPPGVSQFPQTPAEARTDWPEWLELLDHPDTRGSLRARARRSGDPTDPCVASPDASFHGNENQLYRVEIHTGGAAATGSTQGASFMWSRDNGSKVFAILDIATDSAAGTTTVSIERLACGDEPDFAPDDWVEIRDDDVVLAPGVGPLLQVTTAAADGRQVILRGLPASSAGQDPAKHPFLVRWDYGRSTKGRTGADGALPIREGSDPADDASWIDLEDGVQVFFQAGPVPQDYRPGDYWLIPARTATGDVEWPQAPATPPVPAALPPAGVDHHYAPLAVLPAADGQVIDLRSPFKTST